jgi:uncharacterized protein
VERKPNRLIHEKSPYLLQHAYNPIDWHPWQIQAFEEAAKKDALIFLSIGYATCHWCHVMEKEAFQDEGVAKVLNDHFVSIKVDRQEFPAVDSFYMGISQVLMSSAGGWPLNVILTPEGKPFFACTYLPPNSRHGLAGLKDVLEQFATLWHRPERELFLRNADKWMEMYSRKLEKGSFPTKTFLAAATDVMLKMADPIFGGFRGEPKFPLSYLCDFLLRYSCFFQEERSLFFLELSLDNMKDGALFDHLHGGFFRYVVDQGWQLPHFEKMLIENAFLAEAYLSASKMLKNPEYEKVCKKTLDYMLENLLQEPGGFSAAEDADSEGEEGRYYLWSLEEIGKILSPRELSIFCYAYGVTKEGAFKGKNILHRKEPLEEIQRRSGLSAKACLEILEVSQKKLIEASLARQKPFQDEQVLTAWNSWAVSTFVKAARAFDSDLYLKAALDTAEFMQEHLIQKGELYRSYCEGMVKGLASLEDYAAFIHASLTLFEEGLGTKWLSFALELQSTVQARFAMPEGGFYAAQEELLLPLRKHDFYDGVEPSGNAVQAENLIRLYQITKEEKFLRQVEDLFCITKKHMETYPVGAGFLLRALLRFWDEKAPTCYIALDRNKTGKKEILQAFSKKFIPHATCIWIEQEDQELLSLLPHIAEKKIIDEKTTLHVCYKNRCDAPETDLAKILEKIADL